MKSLRFGTGSTTNTNKTNVGITLSLTLFYISRDVKSTSDQPFSDVVSDNLLKLVEVVNVTWREAQLTLMPPRNVRFGFFGVHPTLFRKFRPIWLRTKTLHHVYKLRPTLVWLICSSRDVESTSDLCQNRKFNTRPTPCLPLVIFTKTSEIIVN